MVLRCSLLGHDYGDPEVEREREERGSEVVLTVAEYEACARCGERNVISENTEVTSLEPDAVGDAHLPDDEPTGDAEPDVAEPNEGAADDAELIDAGADDSPAGDDADTTPETAADAALEDDEPAAPDPDHPAVDDAPAADDVPTDEDGEPIVDDAEILEDAAEPEPERERERGEWPDSDDVGPPEAGSGEGTAWPETDAGEEAAIDASTGGGQVVTEPAEGDDATIVDADPAAADDHAAASSPDAETGTGIASAQSAPAPGEGSPQEGVPTEFFCPQCEFVSADDRGSLRSGDICPDCRKGYLSERER